MMTRGQIEKLKTIISKVDTLKNQSSDNSVKSKLGKAREELSSLLRDELYFTKDA